VVPFVHNGVNFPALQCLDTLNDSLKVACVEIFKSDPLLNPDEFDLESIDYLEHERVVIGMCFGPIYGSFSYYRKRISPPIYD
jgi:hypothetical protein